MRRQYDNDYFFVLIDLLSWFCLFGVVLMGCGRDLAPISDAAPEPAFLGELAGTYKVSIMVNDISLFSGYYKDGVAESDNSDFSIGVPLGSRLHLMHIEDVSGSTQDHIFGMFESLYSSEYVGYGAAISQDINSTGSSYDSDWLYLDGTYDGIDIQGTTSQGQNMLAKRLAGGGGLSIQFGFQICDGGPSYPLVVTQSCPFNAALSGVYSGDAKQCDSQEFVSENNWALGFINDRVLGIRFPETNILLSGWYDSLQEKGQGYSFAFNYAEENSAWNTLDFQIKEDQEQLDFTGQLQGYDFSTCYADDYSSCAGHCYALHLSRMSGGDFTTCKEDMFLADAFDYYAVRREDPEGSGQRYLEIEIWSIQEDIPHEYIDSFFDGVLRPIDEREPILPEYPYWDTGEEPEMNYIMRFPLDSVSAGSSDAYELFVYYFDYVTDSIVTARPTCIVDNGEVDNIPWADEGGVGQTF